MIKAGTFRVQIDTKLSQVSVRSLQPTHVTGEDAIAHYYRRHAQRHRVTLRDIANETGLSYDYLRKAKRQYDADGKWGSKKRVTP